jgi:hypothetical protein
LNFPNLNNPKTLTPAPSSTSSDTHCHFFYPLAAIKKHQHQRLLLPYLS